MEEKELMTKRQAEVVLAFARSGMQLTAAAKKLYTTGATISYHLGKVREQTGMNPRDFFDLYELVDMARRAVSGR